MRARARSAARATTASSPSIHSPASPPNRVRARAAPAMRPPELMSPSRSTSGCLARASMPKAMVAAHSRSLMAGCSRMSGAGRSMARSNASSPAPSAWARPLTAAAPDATASSRARTASGLVGWRLCWATWWLPA